MSIRFNRVSVTIELVTSDGHGHGDLRVGIVTVQREVFGHETVYVFDASPVDKWLP